MNYLNLKDIKTIHFEFTSKCNARCPQCARTDNEILPLAQVPIEDVKRFFTPELISQLDTMYSCGNYGDPIVHPDCVEIVRYFKENGCKQVSLHTNGGVRDKEFWTELGKLGTRVVFAIDGLHDTNDIYRVGVRWDNVMENAKTFIEAGGHAIWAYLLFEHNEHQVEEARKLSEEMGFRQFKEKASSRFVGKKEPVINKNKQQINSSKKSLEHNKKKDEAIQTYGTWEGYLANTPIACKTKKEQSVYVDFQGNVFPCCWMGHIFGKHLKTMDILTSKYGANNNSLYHYTLEEILSANWLNEDLVDSWTPGNARLEICSTSCGDKYSPKHFEAK